MNWMVESDSSWWPLVSCLQPCSSSLLFPLPSKTSCLSPCISLPMRSLTTCFWKVRIYFLRRSPHLLYEVLQLNQIRWLADTVFADQKDTCPKCRSWAHSDYNTASINKFHTQQSLVSRSIDCVLLLGTDPSFHIFPPEYSFSYSMSLYHSEAHWKVVMGNYFLVAKRM